MPRTRGTITNRRHSGFSARDQQQLSLIRKNLSGGINTRQHPNIIREDQVVTLKNVDLSVIGELTKISGLTLIEDIGNNSINGALNYDPVGGSSFVVVSEGTNIKKWSGSGLFSSIYSSLASSTEKDMIKIFESGEGDVYIVQDGSNQAQRFNEAGTRQDLGDANTSPPLSLVNAWFNNRWWVLKDNGLYYSDAGSSDYSGAFNRTTNLFRIAVGQEMALVGTRDLGLIVAGKEQIWALSPSATPAATDKPEKIIEFGVTTRKTMVQVGDDYLFLSFDGVRSLKRTVQDKLQTGQSFPLSFVLKEEFDLINFSSINKARATYFDNKYLLSIPVSGSSTNNRVWVYYPASDGWAIIPDWNVSEWVTFKVAGEDRLYACDATDGKFFRAFFGNTVNGTSSTMTIKTRREDLQQPLNKKEGGIVRVVAKETSSATITVKADFDSNGENELGTIDLSAGGVTFPVTYPVAFPVSGEASKTFPIDEYGPWYGCQLSFTCSDDNDEVALLEYSIRTNLADFIDEEIT